LQEPKLHDIHRRRRQGKGGTSPPKKKSGKQFFSGDYYVNKKLSYCWETVRRESMPRIAEMDVEMTTYAEMTFKCKVIKSGIKRKLVYDFLLVVYSNFCRITHRF